jgi:integrase
MSRAGLVVQLVPGADTGLGIAQPGEPFRVFLLGRFVSTSGRPFPRRYGRQAAERLAAGAAYTTCSLCQGAHVVANEVGAPYRPEWYYNQFVRATKAAGDPNVGLHGARNSAASVLADLGVPDVAQAAWLGHMQIKVTQGYQHVMVTRLQEAAQALGDAFAG